MIERLDIDSMAHEGFQSMGVPPVCIHFVVGFSLTIQLLGDPHGLETPTFSSSIYRFEDGDFP